MTYDAIVKQLDEQLAREAKQDEFDCTWIFKQVVDHQKVHNCWEVLMHWENTSKTWESLNLVWCSDPVALANYADEKNLLKRPGWKHLKHYVKNQKKLNKMLQQLHLKLMRTAVKIKFGIRILRNYTKAMELNWKNRDTL